MFEVEVVHLTIGYLAKAFRGILDFSHGGTQGDPATASTRFALLSTQHTYANRYDNFGYVTHHPMAE